jgi:hypothetical protein
MQRRKAFAAILAAALATTTGVVVTSGPAYASCSGAGCIHKNPQSEGCIGTTPRGASVTPPGGGPLILLRWSSGCVANWARFDDSNTQQPGNWTWWVETSDGHREYPMFSGAYWTYMVNGNLGAKACILGIADPNPACTAWY